MEHLAKAVLAARHPSLIVANDFDSVLHACDESRYARPGSKIRTITAKEAVDRAARFVPAVSNLAENLQLLILVRNGVAHLGEASAADTEEVLVAYLKASEGLRAELSIERVDYWGEFVALVDSSLEEHVTQARLRAETALAVARAEFARRFEGFDVATREAMLGAIEASYAPEKYEEQLVDCPACGTPALVSGSIKTDYEPEYDREGFVESAFLVVIFAPGYLHCRACHLELDGEDELRAAGVEESWDLDDVDEADFYEPDYGDWR